MVSRAKATCCRRGRLTATSPSLEVACVLALVLHAPVLTTAFPTYRSAVPNGGSVPCPSARSDECGTDATCDGVGHINCKGGTVKAPDGEFLNPFGKAFAASGYQWTPDLCQADSDGDGITNGAELGDPCCFWVPGMASPVDAAYVISHPGDPNDSGASNNSLPGPAECAALAGGMPGSGTAEDDLVDAMYNEGEDRIALEYKTQPHTLLPNETVYTRFFFALPTDNSTHIVGALAHIDNVLLTHHFVVYLCTKSVSAYTEKPEGAANNPANETVNGDIPPTCLETLFVWAPGIVSMQLPNDTTYELNFPTLFLEVHYNNVDGLGNETDASGLTVYATSQPRTKSAGWLWTGSVIDVGTIPPGVQQYYSNTRCTLELAPQCDFIEVFSFMPHAHFLGTAIWTEHYRRNELGEPELVGNLGADYSFSYENQAMQHFDPTRKVRSGDVISTTCVYDASEETAPTYGGLASQNEMCIGFLLFTNKTCVRNTFCLGVPMSGFWPNGSDIEAPRASAAIAPIAPLPDFAALVTSGHLICQPDNVTIASPQGPDLLGAFGAACEGDAVQLFSDSIVPETTLDGDCSRSCVTYLVNLGACMVSDLAEDYQHFLDASSGYSPWAAVPPQCSEAVDLRVREAVEGTTNPESGGQQTAHSGPPALRGSAALSAAALLLLCALLP